MHTDIHPNVIAKRNAACDRMLVERGLAGAQTFAAVRTPAPAALTAEQIATAKRVAQLTGVSGAALLADLRGEPAPIASTRANASRATVDELRVARALGIPAHEAEAFALGARGGA